MITDDINEFVQWVISFGIPLPDYAGKIILALFILWIIIEPLQKVYTFFRDILKSTRSYYSNVETKAFVDSRSNFAQLLEYEIRNLNKESEWNDFNYTELTAEVEVDISSNRDPFQSMNLLIWMHYLLELIQNLIGIKHSGKLEESLIKAIVNSNSPAFIVIGDPGSGKTVSLRHLFLKMVNDVKFSKNKNTVVPIYLNLKHLNINIADLSFNEFEEWIIKQIVGGNNREVQEFVDKYFNQMLKDGSFFFLFDSFDEIPSVMDSKEEKEIIRKYSYEIDRFLHTYPKCRGLVSSRPYRSPIKFEGQKITILPLPEKRIKKALHKYMKQEPLLVKQLWHELINRDDLISVIQNPFYLGLLAQFCKKNNKLPDRIYDLFDNFILNRAKTDEKRILSFGFSPEELIQNAETLAYAMTKSTNIGLEATVNDIYKITFGIYEKNRCWDCNKIEPLINALTYSQIGRKSRENDENPKFSFVHRRFHEYFCARYLIEEFKSAPFEQLNADNRWREILVLLCEVLPVEKLEDVFDVSRNSLKDGIEANPNSEEYKKALESIIFLKDGFKSRIEDLPSDLRIQCSNFIKKQFDTENLLYQKRALEALIVVDNDSACNIIKCAFEQKSKWLTETAIKSCRILKNIPKEIGIEIREYLLKEYLNLKIYQSYGNYSVFFSYSSSLEPFKVYLRDLTNITFLQFLLFGTLIIFLIGHNENYIITLLYGTIIYSALKIISLLLPNDKERISNKKFNSHLIRIINDGLLSNPFVLFGFSWFFSLVLLSPKLYTPIVSVSNEVQMNDSLAIYSSYMMFFIPIYIHGLLTKSSRSLETDRISLYSIPIILVLSPLLIKYIEVIIDIISKLININIVINLFNKLLPGILILVFIILIIGLVKETLWNTIKEFASALRKKELNSKNLIKLFVNIWFWWAIVASAMSFKAMYADMDLPNVEIFIKTNSAYTIGEFIITSLYSNYDFIFANLLILTDALNIILIFMLTISALLSFLLSVFIGLGNLISDQVSLRKLTNQLREGKISTTCEALNILHSLKTEVTKTQYINLLFKYLPVEKDITLLINEANKNEESIRDLLYQLAEHWNNSTTENYKY